MSELQALDANAMNMVGEQLGEQQQRQGPNRHGLYCEFYMHPVIDEKESVVQGRPIYKEIPYVMIMVPGDKGSVIRRPIRTGMQPKDDNNRFHNEYIAFLEKKDAPLEGTPLSQWPQISRGQCMELEYLNVRTVEHLADMPDGHAGQYMGVMELKGKAKRWLELAALEAPMVQLAAELEERDNKIAAQDDAIKEMQKELKKLKKG